MNSYTITLPIEIRAPMEGVSPEYVIKGYALVPDEVHSYEFQSDKNGKPIRSFKSVFTGKALKSALDQASRRNLFVDGEHDIAKKMNIRHVLTEAKRKASSKGVDVDREIDTALEFSKGWDVPLGKVSTMVADDKGLLTELKLNPHFREVSEEHQKYFDGVWNSIKDGYINGISINFKPTSVIEQDGVEVIDDLDLFGVSLTGGAAMSGTQILEVATRSIKETREGARMETRSAEAEKSGVTELQSQLLETQRLVQEQSKQMEFLRSDFENKTKELEQGRKAIVAMRESQQAESDRVQLERDLKEIAQSPLGFGQMLELHAQVQNQTQSMLSPEAKQMLRRDSSDLVVGKRR